MAINKPVIFCVDDDVEVLAAIDRDLRQHYKSEYRFEYRISNENHHRPGDRTAEVRSGFFLRNLLE